MGKTHSIYSWEEWKEFCEEYGINPREYCDYGFDLGGGDSIDFEFIGDIPKRRRLKAHV